MVAIYTGILLLAVLLIALLVDWHDQGVLEHETRAFDERSIPDNEPTLASTPVLDSVPALRGKERSAKVRVTTQSLWRLQKEAKEMKAMAERIVADATDAEQEIEMLIGPKQRRTGQGGQDVS